MFSVSCPHCGQQFLYAPNLDGQNVACTHCHGQFIMQAPSPRPAPPLPVAAPANPNSIPPIQTSRRPTSAARRKTNNSTTIIVIVAGCALSVLIGIASLMLSPENFSTTSASASHSAGGTTSADLASGAAGAVMLLAFLVIGIGIYVLPSIIAVSRGHQNTAAIVALNLLLGWSFVGWVASLVWSFTEVTSRHNYHYHNYRP